MKEVNITEEMIQDMIDRKAFITELQKEYDQQKAVFDAYMKANDLKELTVGARTVKVSRFDQVKLDSKRIKAEFPEIYQEYGKTQHIDRFTFK